MKIGVIGAGNVGTAIARRLVPRGHQVMRSYSRDAAQLQARAAAFAATAGTAAEAVRFAQVVAITVPWSSIDDALEQAGDLSDKGGLGLHERTQAGFEWAGNRHEHLCQ